jgi:UDP-2,3-diacylglucosamine pyrophosphatase LpxH
LRGILLRAEDWSGVIVPPSRQTRVEPASLRTIFLSDLHLGNAGSRADLVLAFLRAHRAETYYLVGDILDAFLPGGGDWSSAQQRVIDHLHVRARDGAQIVFVRGNHDPRPEATLPARRLPADPISHAVHEAADGRRYLVLHGDAEDRGPFKIRKLEQIGAFADQALRRIDRAICAVAEQSGMAFTGVMPVLMSALNRAIYARGAHERRLIARARAAGLDGIVCGHFHLPALRRIDGLTYANCGDWLDHFAALAEDHTGRLRLIQTRPAPDATGTASRMLRRRLRRLMPRRVVGS